MRVNRTEINPLLQRQIEVLERGEKIVGDVFTPEQIEEIREAGKEEYLAYLRSLVKLMLDNETWGGE